MLARSWISDQLWGFGQCHHCSEHMRCPPNVPWKGLELDLTPQRDGRHLPPRAEGLSNPSDVGEPSTANPVPVAPALHRNLHQWLWP